MSGPFLSVVLPCRNQADHIGAVLARYAGPLEAEGWAYELVVVPNASTDGTKEVVERLARRDPRIVVVENPRGGWGLSVRVGLDAARGEVLCYTNSARTDPEHVPLLVKLYRRHAPCLAKARRCRRQAPLRELGSALYNLEARLLFGIKARDVNGTPKVLPRELYRRLRLTADGDLLDMELMAKLIRLQVPVVEMPVAGFKRHGGKSSTTLGSAWRMYAGGLRLRAAMRRGAA